MTDSNLVTDNAILQKLVVFLSKLLLSVFTAKHQRAVARILNMFLLASIRMELNYNDIFELGMLAS